MRGGLGVGGAVNRPERQTPSCSKSWGGICTCQNVVVNPGLLQGDSTASGKGPGGEGLSCGERRSADLRVAGGACTTMGSLV